MCGPTETLQKKGLVDSHKAKIIPSLISEGGIHEEEITLPVEITQLGEVSDRGVINCELGKKMGRVSLRSVKRVVRLARQ